MSTAPTRPEMSSEERIGNWTFQSSDVADFSQ